MQAVDPTQAISSMVQTLLYLEHEAPSSMGRYIG